MDQWKVQDKILRIDKCETNEEAKALLYQWVKTDVINLKEFKSILSLCSNKLY